MKRAKMQQNTIQLFFEELCSVKDPVAMDFSPENTIIEMKILYGQAQLEDYVKNKASFKLHLKNGTQVKLLDDTKTLASYGASNGMKIEVNPA